MWRDLWWSDHSTSNHRCIIDLKAPVRRGLGGSLRLLQPCDTLGAGISVLTIPIPALTLRLRSKPSIQRMTIGQGFTGIFMPLPMPPGSFACSLVFGSGSAHQSRVSSTSIAALLSECPADDKFRPLVSTGMRFRFNGDEFTVHIAPLSYRIYNSLQ